MPIEILHQSAYLAPLNKVREGVSDVHLAMVRKESGDTITAYIKLYTAPYQLLNEITGYLIAQALGYRVPDYAAVAYVPIARIPEPKPTWIASVSADTIPAWCTSALFADTLKFHFDANVASIRGELAKSSEAPAIVALDEWLANVDRNTGNLLRLAQGRYALIDHGQIIGNMDWERNELDPAAGYANKIRTLLGAVADTLPMKNAVAESAQQHPDVLDEKHRELEAWWRQLGDDAARRVGSFLEYRSQHAFIRSQLGLLV